MSIKAVVFDLDDTLYAEYDYVVSGFTAVGELLAIRYGLRNAASELTDLFAQEKTHVFDRYAQTHCTMGLDVAELVETYRNHTPSLRLDSQVEQTLAILRTQGYKLGIITDGDPIRQRKKIAALGLEDKVDAIIVTDELGGAQYRKPNPAAFEKMCETLRVLPEELLYVGDNPQKDFAVKKYLNITTVQLVGKGLYHTAEFKDGVKADWQIQSIGEIQKKAW